MSELFIKTSKVFKDLLVTQLQNENNFLKKIIENNQNNLYGKKVRIFSRLSNSYDLSGNSITLEEPIEGTFVKLIEDKYSSTAIILIKKENGNYKFQNVLINNFEFIEDV